MSISTKGKKGVQHRQIILKHPSETTSVSAQPDKVLSEGEKRAVALADFLAEVKCDNNSLGIVMDEDVIKEYRVEAFPRK